MKIGLITYDANHLKSEQILAGYKINGVLDRHDIEVFALPFVLRKERKISLSHRQNSNSGAHIRDLCKQYNLPFTKVNYDYEIDNSCELFIILGAGILSEECVKDKKIINCHAGAIPMVRGLDSFKWSIYHKKPMANSLHYIDSETDMGEVISILKTPVFESDTLESFARRHYEQEISMLINFERLMEKRDIEVTNLYKGEATRRMKSELEAELPSIFLEYKKMYI